MILLKPIILAFPNFILNMFGGRRWFLDKTKMDGRVIMDNLHQRRDITNEKNLVGYSQESNRGFRAMKLT